MTGYRPAFDGTTTEQAAWQTAIENAAARYTGWRSTARRLPSLLWRVGMAVILPVYYARAVWDGTQSVLISVGVAAVVGMWFAWAAVRSRRVDSLPRGTLIEGVIGAWFVGGAFVLGLFILRFCLDARLLENVATFVMPLAWLYGGLLGLEKGFGLRDKLLLKRLSGGRMLTRIAFYPFATFGFWAVVFFLICYAAPDVSAWWVAAELSVVAMAVGVIEGITNYKSPVPSARELALGLAGAILVGGGWYGIGVVSTGLSTTMPDFVATSFLAFGVFYGWLTFATCYKGGLGAGYHEVRSQLRILATFYLVVLFAFVWGVTETWIAGQFLSLETVAMLRELDSTYWFVSAAVLVGVAWVIYRYVVPYLGRILATDRVLGPALLKKLLVGELPTLRSRFRTVAEVLVPWQPLERFLQAFFFSVREAYGEMLLPAKPA